MITLAPDPDEKEPTTPHPWNVWWRDTTGKYHTWLIVAPDFNGAMAKFRDVAPSKHHITQFNMDPHCERVIL